jgi:DivIVA domain-containing protein
MLILVVALVAAALAWGVAVLLTGRDPGLEPVEPDGRAIPLPIARPLTESDLGALRFDLAPRGYRMGQVDQALRRAAYDIGYKEELISVLEAEVLALREGRTEEAEILRKARETAARPRVPADEPDEPGVIELDVTPPGGAGRAGSGEPDDSADSDLTDETTVRVGSPTGATTGAGPTGATRTGAATTGAAATGATATGAQPADVEK